MTNDISGSQKWGNVIAREQLISSAKQEQQLQHLNVQLGELRALQQQQVQAQHAQHQQQQWQAKLQQVLFETEETARSLAGLAGAEPFVAAVRARLWLRSIMEAGVNPDQFAAIEHKRALMEAGRVLEQVAHADAARSGDLVEHVVAAWRRHDELRARLGSTTEASLQLMSESELEATNEANTLSSKTTFAIALTMLGVLGSGGTVLLLLAVASSTDPNASYVGPLVLFLVSGIACAVGLSRYSSVSQRIRRLRQEAGEATVTASSMRANLAAYKAFCADDAGGKLLERAFAEHPKLTGG